MISNGYNHHFPPKQKRILDQKRLTVIQNECSNPNSDANLVVILVVTLYSDSDACSVVTLYSVVMNSDVLYSSDRGGSLYSVVIRESCLL